MLNPQQSQYELWPETHFNLAKNPVMAGISAVVTKKWTRYVRKRWRKIDDDVKSQTKVKNT